VQVIILRGEIDRIFFHIAEQRLIFKRVGDEQLHDVRVSGASPFLQSIMLTKPGDFVEMHLQNGRIDKWANETMNPSAPPTAA
jgi:hypothetical protein